MKSLDGRQPEVVFSALAIHLISGRSPSGSRELASARLFPSIGRDASLCSVNRPGAGDGLLEVLEDEGDVRLLDKIQRTTAHFSTLDRPACRSCCFFFRLLGALLVDACHLEG